MKVRKWQEDPASELQERQELSQLPPSFLASSYRTFYLIDGGIAINSMLGNVV
jgi:hypothetical protein